MSTLHVETYPNTWHDEAYMAHHAYTGENLEGYQIDEALSGVHQTVYTRNGKATVAFRGTDLHDRHDINADLSIAGGVPELDPSFQTAVTNTQKVIAKYGAGNVRATGHSLGGTKAFYVSHKLKIPATGFNPGWSPTQVGRSSLGAGWDLSKSHAFITEKDPIAASALLQPGLQTHKIRSPQGLANPFGTSQLMHHIRKHFGKVPLETAAGVSAAEIVSSVPIIGPVVSAGLTAYGLGQMQRDFGGDLKGVTVAGVTKQAVQNALARHNAQNFLFPRTTVNVPTPTEAIPSSLPPARKKRRDGIHSHVSPRHSRQDDP